MKRILLLIVLAVVACLGFAQVASYTFGYSSGTYSEITGGTVLGTATVGGSGATALDNVTYFNTPIPFLFPFNGRMYNQVGINSNGYLIFGGSTAFGESSQISSTTVAEGAVVVYGKDNQAIVVDGSLGEIRYQTLDTAPNRVFVIQWKNFKDYSGAATDLLNFQIKLYEATKVVEFVYGACTVLTAESCQVGLRGTSNADFFARTTTTNWAASTAGAANTSTMTVSSTVKPANGTIYTFTPPAATAVPNVATVVSPTNANPSVFANATLNWADGGGWTNGFKLYFGTTDPAPYVGDLGYVTSYDPPGDMPFSTPYFWKVVPYNSFGDNITGTQWTFTTSSAPLTGTKTIDPAGSGVNNYTTFTAAINALNGAGVGTGGVTFNVADGTYNESPPAITTTGTALNQIIFQAAVGANPVVTPAGGSLTFAFKLTAADYVTFDNIDVTGPTTLIYGYWLAALTANGATNNTIKNCTITVPYGSSSNYGIYSLGVVDGANSNNTFLNNSIVSAYYGIYLTGSSTAGSEAQNLNIQGNTITGARNYGIYVGYGLNTVIQYNNIGFFAGGTTAYYGIYVFGTTSTYNVHHNTISGGYTSSTVYALYNSSGNTTFANNDVTNLYNTSSSGWYGFYAGGGNTIWNGNNIYGIANTGTAAVYTAYITTGNHDFLNNNLYDIATGGTSLYGFYVIGGTTHNIYNNKVYNLRYTGASSGVVYAIHLGGGTTNNVYNNMVYDLRAASSTSLATSPAIRAFSISSGTTNNVWNNTVFLNSAGSNTAFSTAALYVLTSTSAIDLKNNIFVNKSTPGATGRVVAFWKTSAGVSNLSATSNKNIYFAGVTPGAANLIGYFSTTAYPTLDEYKTMAATKDQGSYTEDVPFVRNTDPYDMHIDTAITTRVEGNAIVIVPPVSFDIDNQARHASTPDIGADEGNFTAPAGAPGLVTLLAPTDAAQGINPLTGQLSWSAPAVGGAPTEYWVYVSDDPEELYSQGNNVLSVPTTSLALSAIEGCTVDFNGEYFWAVQAHNSEGESDALDPNYQIWSFRTSAQMAASSTLAIGNAWPSNPKAGTIVVTNLGTSEMIINATGSTEFVFGGTGQYTIPASSSYNVPFTFNAPETLGAYTGSITLTQTSPSASSIVIAVTANVSTEISFGTGTTNMFQPVYPYYGYTYSQTIYPASWFSYPDGYRIEKLQFYWNPALAPLNSNSFKVWMGHTSQSQFPSTVTSASWIPLTGLSLVFDGTAGAGWKELVLQTPFIYNRTDNLVIAMDENAAGYDTSGNTTTSFFHGTTTSGTYYGMSCYDDGDNFDPANPDAIAQSSFTSYASRQGFPNTKFFVGEVPTNPVIAVTPASWDYGTVVVNTTNTKQFTIQNNGGGTLTINGITPASSGYFTLTNLPVGFPATPVNLGTGQSMTFSVQYLPTAAGTHSAAFTIDDNLDDFVVNVNAVCVDPRITSLPHTQNFDGVTAPALPLGWTAYKSNASSSLIASTTYAQSTLNSVYMYNYTTSETMRLISPQSTVALNTAKLSFYARSGSAGYVLKVGTVSALDGTGVFTELASYTLTTTFTQYMLPLSAYAGTDQYLCFQHGATSTYQSIYVDNFQLDLLVANDMAATSITGNNAGFVGTPITHTVNVINNGTAAQSAYTVYLKRAGGARFATLVVNTPIAAGATAAIPITWTPATQETYSIQGEVELTGDAVSANNITASSIAFTVYAAGSFVESFEGGVMPAGWTVRNADGGTYSWEVLASLPKSGTYSARVRWESTSLQNDDWLITPALQLSNTVTDVISFWMARTSTSWPETYEIRLSTTTNEIAAFTNVLEASDLSTVAINTYIQKSFNLDAYGNAVVYLAIRYTGLDEYYLHVDDFVGPPLYTVANLSAPVVSIEPVGANIQLSWAAVTNATQYIISASSDPYTGFTQLAATASLNYTVVAPAAAMKFYKVVASNAPLTKQAVKPPLSTEEQLRKDALEKKYK